MEDNLSLPSCSDKDFISDEKTIFKVEKLNKTVNSLFSKYNLGEQLSKLLNPKNPEQDFSLEARKDNGDIYVVHQKWFDEGIDCDILKVGAKS